MKVALFLPLFLSFPLFISAPSSSPSFLPLLPLTLVHGSLLELSTGRDRQEEEEEEEQTRIPVESAGGVSEHRCECFRVFLDGDPASESPSDGEAPGQGQS